MAPPAKRLGRHCRYDSRMKTLYIFGAILACNTLAVVVGARSTKTALAGVSAALAVYGVVRIIG